MDGEQDDKACELKLCGFARPHMRYVRATTKSTAWLSHNLILATTTRAFHFAWWSFFIAFFIWFAIAPLLPQIKVDLNLSTKDIWTTNICAVSFDICMRFVFGAVCDKYGARIPMGVVLMLASIPTACIGLVNSLTGL